MADADASLAGRVMKSLEELKRLGYVEQIGPDSFRMTEAGKRYVEAMKAGSDNCDKPKGEK